MSKFTVADIKAESKITRATFKGRLGTAHATELTIEKVRFYCDKIDFLCRTIARLERKCTTSKDDPYGDRKIYHKAKMHDGKGNVSPLCAKTPRKLNLKRNSWTIIDADVTCGKCRKILFG